MSGERTTPGTDAGTGAGGGTRQPWAWQAAYVVQQAVVLGIAGLAFLLATWDAPLYKAFLVGGPTLLVPPGIPVPIRLLAPLLVPVVLGIPILFTRQHAPILLWTGVMTLLCVVSVLEVSRLNWAAFVSGVAFRVESGPVPIVRTLAGLAVVLCGLVLMAHQANRQTVRTLAARGVPLPQLDATRAGLAGLEWSLHALLFAAGIVLTVVAAVSMSATEEAPRASDGITSPLVWTGLLLALVAFSFAWGTWRRKGRAGERAASPQRL